MYVVSTRYTTATRPIANDVHFFPIAAFILSKNEGSETIAAAPTSTNKFLKTEIHEIEIEIEIEMRDGWV